MTRHPLTKSGVERLREELARLAPRIEAGLASPRELKMPVMSARNSRITAPLFIFSRGTTLWGTPSKTERSICSDRCFSTSVVPAPKRMAEASMEAL